jgi:hypothetical protein
MSEQQAPYKIEGRPATIFRAAKNKDNPYVMIDRRPIDNKNLSFKAKGILTYLLSRPDGWEVNLVDLANRSTDGLASIKSGVKELKEAGHLKHAGTRNVLNGHFETVIWEVYECPQVGVSPQVENQSPQVDFPQVGNPQVDNRIQVLSTLSNKDSNKNHTHTEKPDFVNLTVVEAMAIPEIRIFTESTGIHPGVGQLETIWQTIRDMRAAGKPVTADRLRPFYLAWTAKGWRGNNLDWLTEWAVDGKIPERQQTRPAGKSRNAQSELLKQLESA